MFCEYCGTKVRLDDYQETHRYVNEAEVKKVEADREIELRKMELEEEKRKALRAEKEKDEETGFKLLALLIAICIIGEILVKTGVLV